MDLASVVFGAVMGGFFTVLLLIAWGDDDKRPLIDQFRDLPDTPEQRARRAGL